MEFSPRLCLSVVFGGCCLPFPPLLARRARFLGGVGLLYCVFSFIMALVIYPIPFFVEELKPVALSGLSLVRGVPSIAPASVLPALMYVPRLSVADALDFRYLSLMRFGFGQYKPLSPAPHCEYLMGSYGAVYPPAFVFDLAFSIRLSCLAVYHLVNSASRALLPVLYPADRRRAPVNRVFWLAAVLSAVIARSGGHVATLDSPLNCRARPIAELIGCPLFTVNRVFDSLRHSGVIVKTAHGRFFSRVFRDELDAVISAVVAWIRDYSPMSFPAASAPRVISRPIYPRLSGYFSAQYEAIRGSVVVGSPAPVDGAAVISVGLPPS